MKTAIKLLGIAFANMVGVLSLAVSCALGTLLAGCSVTKVEYETGKDGVTSYRLYRNSHWLKMEGEGMRGGMTQDGKFEFDLEGLKSSPSEEFNKTMQTYTTAFVQLAQIAAAAYNPSASQAVSTATKSTSTTPTVVVNTQAAETKETTATKETVSPTPTQTSNSQACEGDNCTLSSDAARTSAK